jgi:hypothetical protein
VAQAFDLRRNELAALRFAEDTIRAAAAATPTRAKPLKRPPTQRP